MYSEFLVCEITQTTPSNPDQKRRRFSSPYPPWKHQLCRTVLRKGV
jgi:hypothetical protein